MPHNLDSDLSLALADVVLAEQELAVQVGHVDRVQIDHLVKQPFAIKEK